MNELKSHPGYMAVSASDVVLEDDLVYENDKYIIRVYKGFRTDGGSIPRISWTLLGITPFDPRCVYAFFIHDWLYSSETLSRSSADAILDEVLKIKPSPNAVQRWLIWSHVRMYGWLVWARHTSESVKEARHFGEIIYKGKLLKTVIK